MSGGLNPIAIALRPGIPEAAGLQPGQSFQTAVRLDGNGQPFLRVAEQNIPLPQGAALAHGQRVQVQVTGPDNAIRLEVSPLPAAAQLNRGSAHALVRLVEKLLPALQIPASAQAAAALLPQAMPMRQANVTPMLQLLLAPEQRGGWWGSMRELLHTALRSGRLSPEVAEAAQFVAGDAPDGEDSIAAILRRAALDSRAEARLAGGGEVASLRQMVAMLAKDQTLLELLREQGSDRAFQSAAKQVLHRLDTAAAANLRGLETPYFFFELPPGLLPDATRAQVHVMPEGKNAPGGGERRGPDTVVLDLSLNSLGPVWIQMRREHDFVAAFYAERPETRIAIEAAKGELEDALREAGMPSPQVRVHPWSEDERPARLGALFGAAPLDIDT
jgi:hypothetical protein